jgi:type IV secretory pathway VirB4 component
MDKTQLYWLFLKFIGGEYIDIEGLYLKPERILRDGNTIEFLIHNPNDISFYIAVVEEELDEILLDFSKFTNHKFKYFIDTDYTDIYFNKCSL